MTSSRLLRISKASQFRTKLIERNKMSFVVNCIILVSCIGSWASQKESKAYFWWDQRAALGGINKTGCCNDRMECRNKEYETVQLYMGVDAAVHDMDVNLSGHFTLIYRNMLMQYRDVSDDMVPNVKTGTVLQESAINSRSAAQILSSYCVPKELKKGHMKPEEAKSKDANVTVDKQSRIQAAMFYDGLYHITCDDRVILSRNISYDTKHPIKVKDALVANISRRDCTNKRLHPAFCMKGDYDNLIDVLALPAKNTTFVMGFYGTQQVRSVPHHEREYQVQVWTDDWSKEPRGYKDTGMLSAVTYIRVTEETVKGIYFTNNGKVCPFEYNRNDLLPTLRFGESNTPAKLCVPLAQFLTCPQPWCAIQRVGASFTVKEKGEHMVYLMRGLFFWKLNLRELPLNVPRIKKARFTSDSFALCNASEVYSPKKDDVPCIPFQTEAAFAFYNDRGDEYVFMKGSNLQWLATKNRMRSYETETDYFQETNHFPNVSQSDTTAAWWNQNESSVYIFSIGKYTVYKLDGDPMDRDAWKHVETQKLETLGLELGREPVNEIDAVITAEDKSYLIDTKHHFYEITENNVRTEMTRKGRLTYSELFSTRSDCYYNDMEEYYKIVAPYGVHKEETESDRQFNLGRKSRPQAAGNTNLWIALIIMSGGLVVMVGWAGMYIFGGKEEKFIKVVVTQKRRGEVLPGSHVESPERFRKRKMIQKMKHEH